MSSLRTRLSLRPGERGTRKLHARYGDRLVCVRYRYDEATGRRIKTVELIVDETEVEPTAPALDLARRYIVVRPEEVELRRQVKQAGGYWHPECVAWSLPYETIVTLGLTDRIVTPTSRRKPVSIDEDAI